MKPESLDLGSPVKEGVTLIQPIPMRQRMDTGPIRLIPQRSASTSFSNQWYGLPREVLSALNRLFNGCP